MELLIFSSILSLWIALVIVSGVIKYKAMDSPMLFAILLLSLGIKPGVKGNFTPSIVLA